MSAYARVAVARDGTGWTVSGNDASLAAQAVFPTPASGSGTITHFGVGTASSGAGHLLFKGALTQTIAVSAGSPPKLDTTTKVSQNASDGMTDEAATAFLNLILNNTNWANVGDATGLRGSSTAGNLYLSLHTADPGETGNQTTSEVSYS